MLDEVCLTHQPQFCFSYDDIFPSSGCVKAKGSSLSIVLLINKLWMLYKNYIERFYELLEILQFQCKHIHFHLFFLSNSTLLPSVLIGNKCDMISNRQVTYETGEKLAASWNIPFMETSAKSKQNSVECFCQLVREIKKKEDQLRLTIQETKEERSRCHCTLL